MQMDIKNVIDNQKTELSHISNFFKTLNTQVPNLLKFLMQIYTKLIPKSIPAFLNTGQETIWGVFLDSRISITSEHDFCILNMYLIYLQETCYQA